MKLRLQKQASRSCVVQGAHHDKMVIYDVICI
uniref:Uncharacterized protein n=1 Tax=Musa acuminata subsp. malaccensis TaxID=214687 RepID=A0A804IIL4_MUSAM